MWVAPMKALDYSNTSELGPKLTLFNTLIPHMQHYNKAVKLHYVKCSVLGDSVEHVLYISTW